MKQENDILKPELEEIKNDENYLLYEILMQSLKAEDIKSELNNSLNFLSIFLESNNIVLFKQDNNGVYKYKQSNIDKSKLEHEYYIINELSKAVERAELLDVRFNFSSDFKNMKLIKINVNEDNYILGIKNYNNDKLISPNFWNKVKDTFQIILKREQLYENNKKIINTDLLTGLHNRNSYEIRLNELKDYDENFVFALFDIFRLKFINDNYSYDLGDEYIKHTADTLKRYWPIYKKTYYENEVENKVETGSVLYRVGGDEFALITTCDNFDQVKIKAKLAAKEIGVMSLTKENTPIGLNYGIAVHNKDDSFKTAHYEANESLSDNKKEMYKQYGLERRR